MKKKKNRFILAEGNIIDGTMHKESMSEDLSVLVQVVRYVPDGKYRLVLEEL